MLGSGSADPARTAGGDELRERNGRGEADGVSAGSSLVAGVASRVFTHLGSFTALGGVARLDPGVDP